MARARAKAWLPYFEKSGGHQGRFSIQVNVHNYRSGPAMLAQALEIHAIAPNMQVKIPSTQAGIWAMEEASAAGVSVMATLCYSVSQAEAAAEAVERGLARRAAQGLPTEDMNPVCAVLLDMQDQFQQGYCQKHDIVVDPDCFCYGGVAVAKKVYALYQQKQYRTRMLVAYYGSHLHWSEFIGGDLIMTIPYRWQLRFNASDVPVAAGIDRPVAPRIVEQLCTRVPPYRLAYEQGAMQPADFDSFGPVVRTLLRFGSQYEDALCLVRGIMLPDPLA